MYGLSLVPGPLREVKPFELLVRLLERAALGIELTEHAALTPAASVSDLYFSQPDAKYFNVGRINREQLEYLNLRC